MAGKTFFHGRFQVLAERSVEHGFKTRADVATNFLVVTRRGAAQTGANPGTTFKRNVLQVVRRRSKTHVALAIHRDDNGLLRLGID